MVTGAGLAQAQIVPAIGHRNGDRFPDGRATRPRVECAADSGTVRPTTLAAISRRSGFDFSGAHRARQGFARSARRVRGLDPPGVLPSGWQLPDRRGDKRPSTRAPLTDRKGGGATLGVGWVRTEGGDRASDRSQRTADPQTVLIVSLRRDDAQPYCGPLRVTEC